MAINREVTPKDVENANRLKAIWEAKKKPLELRQTTLAKLLGISQPAVSQYLNATIALNTDMILKFAGHLKVSPSEIDPDLQKTLEKSQATRTSRIIPVFGSLSGKNGRIGEVYRCPVEVPTGSYAIRVDSAKGLKHTEFKSGDYIVLNPMIDIYAGATVLICIDGALDIGVLTNVSRRLVHYAQGEVTYEVDREAVNYIHLVIDVN